VRGCITGREYKYGLKEIFAIKCVNCRKIRTFKEFLLTPLGLCEVCDSKITFTSLHNKTKVKGK